MNLRFSLVECQLYISVIPYVLMCDFIVILYEFELHSIQSTHQGCKNCLGFVFMFRRLTYVDQLKTVFSWQQVQYVV